MPAKVVIITGASSGFGRLAALTAARKGYNVVVTARRAERLHELVGEIEAAGGTALAVSGDINDENVQQGLIDQALHRFGRIDALVNNAGVPLAQSYSESALADLRRQWNTNTTTMITLTHRALPELRRRSGVVINISSGISRFSVPSMGLYAPSKVAASSISDALRRELQPQGVKVCIVEPGPYHTEFGVRAGARADQQFGLDPQDVANAIVRLIERPKRMTVLPRWMHPVLLLLSGLMRALPGPVDLIFFARAKRRQQQKRAETADSAA